MQLIEGNLFFLKKYFRDFATNADLTNLEIQIFKVCKIHKPKMLRHKNDFKINNNTALMIEKDEISLLQKETQWVKQNIIHK